MNGDGCPRFGHVYIRCNLRFTTFTQTHPCMGVQKARMASWRVLAGETCLTRFLITVLSWVRFCKYTCLQTSCNLHMLAVWLSGVPTFLPGHFEYSNQKSAASIPIFRRYALPHRHPLLNFQTASTSAVRHLCKCLWLPSCRLSAKRTLQRLTTPHFIPLTLTSTHASLITSSEYRRLKAWLLAIPCCSQL